MSGYLGTPGLRRRHRPGDAMRSFAALPPPLRRWLREAALPWSPASARKLWHRATARGLTTEDALAALTRAELRTLQRQDPERRPIPR